MPPYSSGGGDLLSPPCTQPTHLYQSRDHSCTHNWDFHIQFAKSPPRTVGNIFIWRVQYGEEDKDCDFVWKIHSAARYILQQWNSSLPWSLLVSQYNEATFFFFMMDTTGAITQPSFPNKRISCHCLCQGKGNVGRGAAAKHHEAVC